VAEAVAKMTPHLKPGTVIVDCSTSDPTVTERLATDLAAERHPLRRRPPVPHPERGLGGHARLHGRRDPEDSSNRIQPVIATWAGKIVHIGRVGDGHRMKLLNNFLSLGYAAIYAEALAVAARSASPPPPSTA
jgi:3-hydroxyisobutyrate dehydrogenase-like beta-hydroxyacid dehydrogenase